MLGSTRRQFFLESRYVVPDPKTIKQLALEKYDKMKSIVVELVKNCDSLKSWTTDGWSSSSLDPYLIMTAHFIDKEFKYYNIVFDFAVFPHPHDQISISEMLYEVIIC